MERKEWRPINPRADGRYSLSLCRPSYARGLAAIDGQTHEILNAVSS